MNNSNKNKENLTFQAEVSKLLDLVANSLYSEREIFLRELISNSADACEKLRYLALSKKNILGENKILEIKINVSKKRKIIEIEDNGIGMSRQDLIDNLGTIARSGTNKFIESIKSKKTNDISAIGQFGVGFYSSYMVADTVAVHSKNVEDAVYSSFFYKNKIQFLTKNKTLNFILIILYLNFTFQFIGLYISENNINNSYYLFLAILSIIAVVNLYNNGLHKINYLISLCVLTSVVIAYGYLSYKYFFTTRNLNMYGTFPDVFLPLVDFSSNVIRSSGLSRSSTIISIPLFYLILIDKIKFFYLIPYARLVYLIPYLILCGIIFFCQSRIVILFFLSFSIFSIFYFLRNKTKKYKFKKAFILIILPAIFVISLVAIKEEVHSKNFTNRE